MADNDNFDWLELALWIDELKEIERRMAAAASSSNDSRPDSESCNSERRGDDTRIRSSLEGDGNSSVNSFPQKQGVSCPPLEPFMAQSCGKNLDVPTSDSDVGTQQSHSRTAEEDRENFCLVPVEASRGDFFRADENRSNPSESFHSSLQDSEWIDSRPAPHEERTRSNLAADASGCRKEENLPTGFFRKRKNFDSSSTPQMLMGREGNKAKAPKLEHRIEIASASVDDNDTNVFSSCQVSNRVAHGSVVDAEGLPVAEPSGMQEKSRGTGREKPLVFKRQPLQNHERTHTGDRPFVCGECDQTFAQKRNLMRHLRTHTGEKPFACELCNMTFARNDHLERHLRTHSGEKPFECKECDTRFSQSFNYRRHMKQFHGRK